MVNQRHSLQENPAGSALFEMCNYSQWDERQLGMKDEMQKAMTKTFAASHHFLSGLLLN